MVGGGGGGEGEGCGGRVKGITRMVGGGEWYTMGEGKGVTGLAGDLREEEGVSFRQVQRCKRGDRWEL